MNSPERNVKLVCTGQGRGEHPEKRVDRVVLRAGLAVSIDPHGGADGLRRAYEKLGANTEIADFSLRCTRCSRAPQLSRDRMTVLVTAWLDQEPDRHTVVRDISDPHTATLM